MTENEFGHAANAARTQRNMRYFAIASGLLLPVSMLLFVPILRQLAHSQPGGWVGFRTARSTGSIENWQLAQNLAANHFLVLGIISLFLTILAYWIILRLKPLGAKKLWLDARTRNLWWVTLILMAVQLIAMFISTYLIDSQLTPVAEQTYRVGSTAELLMAFGIGILTPIGCLICAPFSKRLAQGRPNMMSGFRTELSMSSQEHWEFAQLQSAKYFVWVGVISLIATLAIFAILLISGNRSANAWWYASLIGAGLGIVGMVGLAVLVQNQLKKLPAPIRRAPEPNALGLRWLN